ncbi:hypothetical protein DFQ27_005150 [Actinomortierella ambigua]|uniref:Secreted protein n=1 Tax=Actinomortierella ambigua TaxID=1343610 RepID=A0A9P6U301_9FUNG|nr:hypothetical protein DFQ27_005150 [Actinomortierella ambigua]
MKCFATLAAFTLLASSAKAWCMNAHDSDDIDLADLKDQCGKTVKSGDVFVLYDDIHGNYLGNGEKNWLTLTKTAPAGFFWQLEPRNRNIAYLKGTAGYNCSVKNRAWFGYRGRYMAATGCSGGGFLEFRKWDKGQCSSSDWCYQIGLLSGDQPVNGAIANYATNGYVNTAPANCADKSFKWVLRRPKAGVPWKATYSLDELQSC